MKRKIISLCTFILAMIFALGLTACDALDQLNEQLSQMGQNLGNMLAGNGQSSTQGDAETLSATVEETTETVVVIKVEEASQGTTLIDVMEYLQEENAFSFEISDGMISAINGKANPADWSASWMLYTSDAELSNTAWGTYEYDGQTLGSATLGAEALTVIDGGVYVWYYQSF